jgi:hypothetical protein
VTHAKDAGNLGHGQPLPVGGTNRLVTLSSQFFGGSLNLSISSCMFLGKGR